MKPEKIEQISGDVLTILWDDGKVCIYYSKSLRANCPCAVCKEEKENDNPLKVINMLPDDLELIEWKWVGRYAISLAWNDGHDTGIYIYEYLRKLCDEESEKTQ
jgi:DUF971 family protein